MMTIGVLHDPARPFIIHRRGEPSSVIQVPIERVAAEVDLARAAHRSICVHQLYVLRNHATPEAICERDDFRFVAL